MSKDSQREVIAADGTAVPLYWYPAAVPTCALLLLPALGIQARLYRDLAAGLALRGCSTLLLEQRGHGRSQLRAGYGERFDLDDLLERDIPAALDWLERASPGAPLLLGGHSLGGHLSTIYAGREPARLAGIIHLACAFPYYKDYGGSVGIMLRLLCALIPLFRIAPGYYPGSLLGFGERESVAMMMQWRQWALRGDLDFDRHSGLSGAVAEFQGPVLSISLERDSFSTGAAVERALAPYPGGRVTRRTLGPAEQGAYLGHTAWAKRPDGVVDAIARWLDAERLPRPGSAL